MIRSTHSISLVALLFCGAIAACGGSQSTPAAPETATEAPAESAAPPEPAPAAESASAAASAEAPPVASAAPPAEEAFDKKTDDQKKEFMKTVVLPHMKEQFLTLNAKRYEKMNCTTCHGAGAKEGKFKMPNKSLPKLDPTDGFAKHKKKTPEVLKFMMEKVVPDMSKLLGIPPYNPETKQGFGCFDCHTKQGA